MPIDRRAVVRRHNPTLTAWDPLSPLTVGNGEFAFTADVTGLQTLGAQHERSHPDARPSMPLGTQAQWAYHWAPNPEGWTIEDTEKVVPGARGDFPYPIDYDFDLDGPASAAAGQAAGYYFWTNPQRLHLGRIALVRADGSAMLPHEISDPRQELDLWTGVLASRFSVDGHELEVTTVCHPDRDLIAVRVEGIPSRRFGVRLEFPGVAATFDAEPVWDSPDSHRTEIVGDSPLRLRRQLDDAVHHVGIDFAAGVRVRRDGPHSLRFEPADDGVVELAVEFSPSPLPADTPSFAEVLDASARSWPEWWSSGAAVDLSSATDPRAIELERRVVLSQYQTAINCAGSTPPQETGLVCNSWGGTFHLEMHWWHAAHFAAWGRPEILERSLAWYLEIMPRARENAERHGLRGAQWPKHVGPEAVESPNEIGPLLVWQQPHPIHFAELVRRAHPDAEHALRVYGDLVDETARCIASMLVIDDDGSAHIPPPLVPAQEMYDPATTWDPLFEMAYFRWALQVADEWRGLRGLQRDETWARLADGLVPPVPASGVYAAVGRPERTAWRDHPSMAGALGVVPDTGAIDEATMRATLDAIDPAWEWTSAWGWDFPMLAMCATRLGDPSRAFDYLLRDEAKNVHLPNGHNFQDARLPLYLPGNGGLLMAVGLLASGWVGADGAVVRPTAPGWELTAEGFPPRA